jgi:putative transposase
VGEDEDPRMARRVDGAPGLAKARAGSARAGQRGAAQKQRNLLAPAPRRPREEISTAYKAMIHAESKPERAAKGKALLRKRRLKWRAVAARLEEAGDQLFTGR